MTDDGMTDVGWTGAEYDQCPELAARLHRRILDLEDKCAGLEHFVRQVAEHDEFCGTLVEVWAKQVLHLYGDLS